MNRARINTLIFLSGVLIFSWLIYVAIKAQSYLILGLKQRVMAILELSIFGGSGRSLLEGSPVPLFERLIQSFSYPLIMIIFCVLGSYILFFKNKHESSKLTLLFFGPVLYFASWPLILTSIRGAELAYRSWAFLFVGVAFTFALGFKLIREKRSFFYNSFLAFSLIVMLIGGISNARNETFRFPGSYSFVDDNTFYTLPLFRTADWLDSKHRKGLHILGTFPEKDVLGSYGTQYVDSINIINLIFENNLDEKIWNNVDYLAIDNRITQITYSRKNRIGYYECSYFGAKAPDSEIGYIKPIPNSMLDKFNGFNEMNKVYDNEVINLYQNSK